MQTHIRQVLRVSEPMIVHPFGKIVAASENGTVPNSAETEPGPNPNTYLGGIGAVTDRTNERHLIALNYLHRVADDMTRVARQRIYYMDCARTHGATWQEIGTALGITDTGARRLYERNADALVGGEQ